MTDDRPRSLTRRTFLGGTAAAAGTVALAACGGGGDGGRGRLRAALAGGGSRETLDPHVVPQFVDQARSKAVYDTLIGWSQEMTATPRLAESWESDPTGTRWRIRLRAARFHDGRPVTADDVLASFRRIADPATGATAAASYAGVDFAASRAVSPTEVEVVLGAPNHLFPLSWGSPGAEIVPQGFRADAPPVGSGPFRYVSFRPGGPALYRANEAYWDGRPRAGELEIVPIDEETARVGALLSGQVAYAHDLRATSARQLGGDDRVRMLSAPASNHQFVNLRVDRPPFSDPRLREAFRLGIDRAALVRVALLDRGTVGGDVFGVGQQYYPTDVAAVPRDVARASALVDEAGARGLAVELATTTTDPAFQPAAGLIAAQLGEIGLRVTPRALPSANYFADIRESGVASQSRTGPLPITDYIGRRMVSGGSPNYTGYVDPAIDGLLASAAATTDEGARTAAIRDVQQRLQRDSGYVIWAAGEWHVGAAAGLSGVEAARANTHAWARFDRAVLT